MYQQNSNRKKKSMHFPAVMFFGLIITCVVVIVAVSGKNLLHKGDDLLQGKDSGTTLAAEPETSGAYTDSNTNKSSDSTGYNSNIDKSQ